MVFGFERAGVRRGPSPAQPSRMFGIGVEVETGLNDEDGCPHLLRAFLRFLELSVRAIASSQ